MNARYSGEFDQDPKGRTCLVFYFSRDITKELQRLAQGRPIHDFVATNVMSGCTAVINADYDTDRRAIIITFGKRVKRYMVDAESFGIGLKSILESPPPARRARKRLSRTKHIAMPMRIRPETARMITLSRSMRSS